MGCYSYIFPAPFCSVPDSSSLLEYVGDPIAGPSFSFEAEISHLSSASVSLF